jgi:DNA-binding GntR family transcriptional regulator
MPEMLSLPASRTEHVLEEIRRAILTRRLLPGQPLVEMELANQLGVSKTPVREALKILSGSGLVTFSPYKGASVRVVDHELAMAVYDVRLLLEPEAVGRAVRRAEQAGLDDAGAALAAAAAALESGDHAELSLCNRSFHQAMYAGCGNPLLISVLDDLRDRAALISVVGWETSPSWDVEWQEHREILTSATVGRHDETAELTRRHIQGFLDRIVATMDVPAEGTTTTR